MDYEEGKVDEQLVHGPDLKKSLTDEGVGRVTTSDVNDPPVRILNKIQS